MPVTALFCTNFSAMSRTNISIEKDLHAELVAHLGNGDRKIGKWTEAAIREKIQKESKKNKHGRVVASKS